MKTTRILIIVIILWIGTIGFWYADHRKLTEQMTDQYKKGYTKFTKFEEEYEDRRIKEMFPTITEAEIEKLNGYIYKGDYKSAADLKEKLDQIISIGNPQQVKPVEP